MANIETDSDAGAQVPVAVGGEDQTGKSFYDLKPNWLEDGHGIRGPQRPIVPRESATPEPIEFAISPRRVPPGIGAPENCNPGDGADTSLKYIKATQWDTDTSTWTCVWLPTCTGTCET